MPVPIQGLRRKPKKLNKNEKSRSVRDLNKSRRLEQSNVQINDLGLNEMEGKHLEMEGSYFVNRVNWVLCAELITEINCLVREVMENVSEILIKSKWQHYLNNYNFDYILCFFLMLGFQNCTRFF